MSRTYIPDELRRRVALQASFRCGYCLTSERIVGAPMHVDHLVPELLGGATVEENLWLACPLCNSYKGDKVSAPDPVSGHLMPLFNPRRQVWREHFAWVDAGARIFGVTAIGRATVEALRLNRPSLVRARRRWVEVGWHPPEG